VELAGSPLLLLVLNLLEGEGSPPAAATKPW